MSTGALEDGARLEQTIASLQAAEASLNAARAELTDCEDGCITPSEATRLAFALEEGEARAGRFLLEIRSGGKSLFGNLGQLYFLNSKQDYARFGTLTIAFEESVLQALLRRARVCSGGPFVSGSIEVKGCRQQGLQDVNIFTMMQRLNKRRIVVDGEVRLQWIDAGFGLRNRTSNIRGEHERGYYQPWVWVEDADQISLVATD
ncbi:MAG: hypothetical protein AAFR88_02700 [Pseudomonadota bacterium]